MIPWIFVGILGAAPGFDDPLLPQQWAIRNAGEQPCYRAGADANALPAWEITLGSEDVVVVVMDSGCELDHPDLAPRLFPQGEEDWNFTLDGAKSPVDSRGHGTAVAGIAVAAAGNGAGISGIAPGCRLMPLKIEGLDMDSNFIEALDYVVDFSRRHPDLRFVVNGSFHATDTPDAHDAVKRAHAAGIVLCFAAGNHGGAVDTPAAYPEAIAVGAIGPDGYRMRDGSCHGKPGASAVGPELDVVAPGVHMPTTDRLGAAGFVSGDFMTDFSGTSAACPVVAGIAALMLSVNPGLSPDRVREILTVTAVDRTGNPKEDARGFDPFMGWGRVDAGRAVDLAARDWKPAPGDVDCSGETGLEDILILLSILFAGEPSTPCFRVADSNGDGRTNIADAIRIANWLFQGGPPPSMPSE